MDDFGNDLYGYYWSARDKLMGFFIYPNLAETALEFYCSDFNV